ncbi:LysR family glycine cleavage system transcriptional activator [Agrobacterium larrymoorei]|uniref:HTH-type transcriptional regulator TtuA n=1 Tax=Agrobacterium larrymoorei TaxID=160699 RepID=A0AAJ2B6V0_9HYPH|nr:LysR substrate-binding domain-containing protein [Agrobacterium larrymoorei]MDR6100470.1 LysR family glycine cleavage system transcriptional activator [Agrobacterium larrymoorei]
MRRFLPSLSALQAFDAAARHMSFTKAGEELAITQSGVSRHVVGLENFLGLRLFERSGSRLVLTDAGDKYFHDVVKLLNKLEEVSIDVVRGRKMDASLMVGAYPALASRWLTPRMHRFINAQSDTPIEVVAIGPEIDFLVDRIDIAILRGSGSWANARSTLLFQEELVVVASPKLMPVGVKPDVLDFQRYPTLQNAGRPSLWLTWLRVSGQPYSGAIQGLRFANSDMLIAGACNALGLAVVPAHYVEDELRSGALHIPFQLPVLSGEAYWVVHPEAKAQKEALSAFRDWLIQEGRRQRGDQKLQSLRPRGGTAS